MSSTSEPFYPLTGPNPTLHEGVPLTSPSVLTLFDISNGALGELRSWFEQNPGRWPVDGTQISGEIGGTIDYSQVQNAPTITPLTAQESVGNIGTDQTTGSTAYVVPVNAPNITGLVAGTYLVSFGCVGKVSAQTSRLIVSVSVNNATPSDNDRCGSNWTSDTSLHRTIARAVSNATNSFQWRFRSTAGDTVSARDMYLVASRIA